MRNANAAPGCRCTQRAVARVPSRPEVESFVEAVENHRGEEDQPFQPEELRFYFRWNFDQEKKKFDQNASAFLLISTMATTGHGRLQ